LEGEADPEKVRLFSRDSDLVDDAASERLGVPEYVLETVTVASAEVDCVSVEESPRGDAERDVVELTAAVGVLDCREGEVNGVTEDKADRLCV
jgi:hypothetical protein